MCVCLVHIVFIRSELSSWATVSPSFSQSDLAFIFTLDGLFGEAVPLFSALKWKTLSF